MDTKDINNLAEVLDTVTEKVPLLLHNMLWTIVLLQTVPMHTIRNFHILMRIAKILYPNVFGSDWAALIQLLL